MTSLPEVIRSYIEAYNRKDVPGMLACLTDDVVFRNYANGRLTVETTGRRAFEDLALRGAAAFETRHQSLVRTISVEDTTLAEVEFVATVSAQPPAGLRAGQRVAVSGTSMFRLEAGRIRTLVDQT